MKCRHCGLEIWLAHGSWRDSHGTICPKDGLMHSPDLRLVPMMTEADKDRLFNYWLRVEQDHAAAEREACRENRHDQAAIHHASRWRCLNNAQAIAEDRPQDVR